MPVTPEDGRAVLGHREVHVHNEMRGIAGQDPVALMAETPVTPFNLDAVVGFAAGT